MEKTKRIEKGKFYAVFFSLSADFIYVMDEREEYGSDGSVTAKVYLVFHIGEHYVKPTLKVDIVRDDFDGKSMVDWWVEYGTEIDAKQFIRKYSNVKHDLESVAEKQFLTNGEGLSWERENWRTYAMAELAGIAKTKSADDLRKELAEITEIYERELKGRTEE